MRDCDLEKMVGGNDEDRLVADAKRALRVALRLQVELIKAVRNIQEEMMENRNVFFDILVQLRDQNKVRKGRR